MDIVDNRQYRVKTRYNQISKTKEYCNTTRKVSFANQNQRCHIHKDYWRDQKRNTKAVRVLSDIITEAEGKVNGSQCDIVLKQV